MVGVTGGELLDMQLQKFDGELEESGYIAAVRCEERSYFRYSCTTQKVVVEHVFKGEGIREGDIIEIAKAGSAIFRFDGKEYEGMSSINLDFTNEMQQGNTYLVFLDRRINTHDKDIVIYETEDFLLAPVFCYRNIVNEPCSVISEENYSARYSDVMGNEYFLKSENDIGKMAAYKDKLLAKYSLK